jgi:hypothetical protein
MTGHAGFVVSAGFHWLADVAAKLCAAWQDVLRIILSALPVTVFVCQ